ncbi:TraR/DksA C4-type zinc finger protein [Ideonella sp. BN130291]|uniref:TraR/DksA C4-type zinc finger protein n=1 Tax=Ideonella sp. BN130291 TaxID=3112940 RepID=UPI002E25EA97|nr:TraR/DksA C4-type zinc finger protein [Ideonella sp. BN130291]
MNTMMLALLQGRLWDTASSLQQQLQGAGTEAGRTRDAAAGLLHQVFQALDAVQAGRYGVCADCERDLEPDELLRKPYRLLCPECEALAPTWRRSQLISSPAGRAPDTRATS